MLVASALDLLFDLKGNTKLLVKIMADIVLGMAALVLGMALRLEDTTFLHSEVFWLVNFTISLVAVAGMHVFRLYRTSLRHQNSSILIPICGGAALATLVLWFARIFLPILVPRSMPIIFAVLFVVLVSGTRILVAAIHSLLTQHNRSYVVIFGAGDSGRQLHRALKHSQEFRPVGFLDDDAALQGRVFDGAQVYAPENLGDILEKRQIKMVLLAMPSATPSQRKRALERIESFGIQVRTIPGIADLVTGAASVGEIRAIEVEELLGRDPVEPDLALMGSTVTGRIVLVTGAGGSIGMELCRQIIRLGPKRLLLLDSSEHGLYSIDLELGKLAVDTGPACEIIPFMGSILDRILLDRILGAYPVETIFHAAAYKHVPMVEYNTAQVCKNNVLGTRVLVDAAVAHHVASFILISTDKAVRPTNVMGATKRLSELICQAYNSAGAGQTQFTIVRFGNVLGSSGSVIPAFRQQLNDGGPLHVTHQDITRFFMTIPEAAQLVLQAAGLEGEGCIFLLDMGEPVRILDLAKRMARLSGYRPVLPGESETAPDGDDNSPVMPIVISGLRPGEKLYEELLIDQESIPTAHPRIMRGVERFLPSGELNQILADLQRLCEEGGPAELRQLLKDAPIDYVPTDEGIADLLEARSTKQ